MFGVVAEKIGKAKVGGRTFAFVADKGATLNREAFFAAPTGSGAGAETPLFDFAIRELGSATPTVVLTLGFALSSDNKTATYTDVDGDLVTVKRSAGTFVMGDFTISTGSGGGQLRTLNITPAPNDAPVSLTITAKPGPLGGNGLVNVGEILATGIPLGTVTVAGDLGRLIGGLAVSGKPGAAAFSVHSLGTFGFTTGAGSTLSNLDGGLGKLTVAADMRGASVVTSETIGSATIGGRFATAVLTGGKGVGTVKIGGSDLGGQIASDTGPLGAITIGGDFTGGGFFSLISFGQVVAPPKGLDLAIKSLTVKGNVENVFISAGGIANADASIGAINVGRAWIASNVQAGVEAGPDSFIGTSDDKKITGGTRDVSTRFSTIASVLIKGQALGSFGSTTDSFGIVAEQILKAKVGTITYKLTKGEHSPLDFFALAPTGPGPAPDNAASDFFIREITS
jgi:hypothetical protein